MRIVFIAIIIVSLLNSCKQKAERVENVDSTKSNVKADKSEKKEAPVLNDENAYIYNEYFVKLPITKFDPFKKSQITITDPSDIEDILKQLFPGKLCTEDVSGEKSPIIVWKTSYSKTKKIKAFFDDEEDEFPLHGEDIANETRFEDSFYYQINNTSYYAFFFSSSNFDGQVGFMRTGRFNCAAYGVAVFKKVSNGWQLENYNPAVDCFGMFGNPHKPHKIALSENKYGFYLTNGIQGAGGPYHGGVYFYSLSDNIPQILIVSRVERYNTPYTNWWFELETNRIEGYEEYALRINIEGYINNEDLEEGEEENLPNQYKMLVKKGGNYKFSHSQTYTPTTEGFYKFDRETFDYRPWPLDTVNGNASNRKSWFLDF